MQRLGLALPLAGALVLGCGSDPVRTPPGATEPLPVTCMDPAGYADQDPSFPPLDVGAVKATILTTNEDPAVDAMLEVCGVNVCTKPVFADSDGNAAVFVDSPTQKPALKYGDALVYGEVAVLFDASPDGTDFGTLHTPKLPDTGSPIAPGAPAQSGGVTLTLAKNGSMTLDAIEPYDTADARGLRAAELPHDQWPAGLDHGAGLDLVFTLAPLGAKLCPPAALEVPNSAGWAPGTAVEFSVQGFDAGIELFAPYGEWQAVATGVVDDTGQRLVMTNGGLPVISNVGVRRL
jgi:hypothetical protein